MDRTVQLTLSLAHNFRLLKTLEMQEARRYASMRDRCVEPEAKEFLRRRVTNIARDARKWSRALVKAQRDLRRHMLDRRLAKFISEVPRQQWVIGSMTGGNIR